MPKIEVRIVKYFLSVYEDLSCVLHTSNIEIRLVAYKRLKTKENYTTVTLESTEITHKEVIWPQAWKVGRSREMVAYGDSTIWFFSLINVSDHLLKKSEEFYSYWRFSSYSLHFCTHSFINPSIYSFIRSFVRWFIYSFIFWFFLSFINSFICYFT